MIVKAALRPHVLLIRPGATDFDVQGRIKGSLDMPMSELGRQQVSDMTEQVAGFAPAVIYCAPCESAVETARQFAARLAVDKRDVKVKTIDAFRNLNHGLWEGKLIDELRRNNPKLYRCGVESADDLVPPGGESVMEAKHRVMKALAKVIKKSSRSVVAIVIPDPMGEIVRHMLIGEDEMSNLWKYETDNAHWDLIEA